MKRTVLKEIGEAEWAAVASTRATALSRSYRPASDLKACVYDCAAEDFLSEETYLVRFTDPTCTRLVNYDDPLAQPITIDDFSKNPTFVEALLNGWYKPELGKISHASLITMHCTGCGRRIVIDGVHHIVWIARYNRGSASVEVTEISGRGWPRDMPDMNVVCACQDG